MATTSMQVGGTKSRGSSRDRIDGEEEARSSNEEVLKELVVLDGGKGKGKVAAKPDPTTGPRKSPRGSPFLTTTALSSTPASKRAGPSSTFQLHQPSSDSLTVPHQGNYETRRDEGRGEDGAENESRKRSRRGEKWVPI